MATLSPSRLLLLAVSSLSSVALAKTVFYELNVTYGFAAPDCVNKQVFLINGMYPGPTLTGTEGDTMSVVVRNQMAMDGVSMHWHGIKQLKSNLNDGTAFVTQCPVNPGDFLNYTFTLDKAGTYMYHGHLGDHVGGGMYGKLFVYEDPQKPLPYKYDGELAVILNDWYHRSVYEQVAGLNNIPFIFVGEPQSLLLNGRGEYNCSLIPPSLTPPIAGDVKVCNASAPGCAIEVFEVEQGKTYRFRISSIASLSSQNLVIEGHTMTVIMADAYTVKPFVVGPEGLDVYPGMTFDVLVTADQAVGNYWVRTGVFARKPNTPPGKAVFRYKGADPVRPSTPLPDTRVWDDVPAALAQAERFRGLMAGKETGGQVPPVSVFPGEQQGSYLMPRTPQSPQVLIGAQQRVQGRIRWAINNISFEAPPVPFALGIGTKQEYLYEPNPQTYKFAPWNLSAPAPTDATYGSGFYKFKFGSTVDIVLQNAVGLTPGVEEFHPWHLHGHQFWVLAYGTGVFQDRDHAKFNLIDPPYRNTATIMPFGWLAIRVVVDNPGVWLFHCHIASHLHMGMAVVIVDGKLTPVPEKVQRCGLFY